MTSLVQVGANDTSFVYNVSLVDFAHPVILAVNGMYF
jgi:hypothetical protein